MLRGIPARVTSFLHKGILTEYSWHMQCLDDRDTQMEEETISVTFGEIKLQVGFNRTVIMFLFGLSGKKESDPPLRFPASTPPPPVTHYNSCPPTNRK